MTATMPLTRSAADQCNLCGEAVLRRVGAGTGRLILLEATPTAGGLYELVTVGSTAKAKRRNMVQVHRELRAGRAAYGGGYEKHICQVRPERGRPYEDN